MMRKNTEFKEVKGVGRIPVDWEVRELKNICEILDSKRKPIKQEERIKGNIPYYGATGIIDFVDDYTFDEDIILVGEDGENLISRVLPMAFRVSGKSWVNNHAHVIKPYEDNIDYVTYYLEQIDYILYITGTAQPKLNQEKLNSIKILLPPIKEQEKIAQILSNVDMNIEKTEQAICKYKQVKKGLMEDLLTGKVRIKDGKRFKETRFKEVKDVGKIPWDWEVKTLLDIATICYGKDQKSVEDKEGKYDILGTGGVMSKSREYLYDEPSVLIGRKGTINNPMYIERPFWTVDTLFYTKISSEYVPKWFYYSIKRVNLEKYNEATGVPSLSVSNLNPIKFVVPCKLEQKNISDMISTQDEIIEKEEKYLEKLNKLKSGLMEDLLTGKVRVNID